MLKKLLLLIMPLAILASGWFLLSTNKVASPKAPLSQDSASTEKPTLTTDNSPAPTEATDVDSAIADEIIPSASSSPAVTSVLPPDAEVDVTTLAVDQRLTDEEFAELEVLLQQDKELRLELLNEFRYNTDPERAKQLAALLGPYNDPEIFQTASELVYSGDPVSKTAGLDLLRRIQPHNSNARDVAIDLLSAETDTEFLVSTMNVLAKPTDSVNESQRQLLTDNLSNLSNHPDPRVRSQSLSLMGRWDKNSLASRDSLTRGLSDTDPAVKSSAVYAIRNIQNPDEYMVDGLLNIAENTDIKKSTRHAALEALEKMGLNDTSARRYNLAKRNINRRVVITGN